MKLQSASFGQNGFGMIEALVSSLIVVIAALGLGTGFQQIGKTKSKVQTVAYAMSLESALQAKLQDKATYTAVANQLSSGVVSGLGSMTMTLQVPIDNTIRTPTIQVGQDVFFDRDANVCTSCNTGANWLFKVRVEARKKAGTVFPVYVMAYRIDFNSEVVVLGAIGSQSPSSFTLPDYKWAVPPEAYVNTTLVPCDPASKEIFITGVNKDTAQAYCMQLDDSVTCGANQVADGWRVVGGNLQIHCKTLATSPAPAAPYAVQSFNASTSDSVITGTAVVITDSPWPLQTASGHTPPYTGRAVSGPVCPPNYSFVGTCTTTGVSSWPGYVNVGCPAGFTGGPVWSAVPPTGVGNVTNTSSGANVNCTLANPVQPTGSGYDAGWDANIQVTGSCVLNIPVTVPL